LAGARTALTVEAGLADDLRAILRRCPTLMRVMEIARASDLPDWLIFSGAIYQPVWNHLTGRPLENGIKDYDLGYFDGSDLSYEAEDLIIERVARACDKGLRERVEVRNQARVHLWFENHFGVPYHSPLANTAQALERFLAPAFAVGARLIDDGGLDIVAPFGLRDVFAMRIRRNPGSPGSGFDAVVAKTRKRWPELSIDN